MSFNVKVKFFGRAVGSELIQSISPDMTIRSVKQALAERVDDGVSPDRLKLIYLGRVMADDHTVGQYGVAENQVLHMVVKPSDTAEQPSRPQPSTEPAASAGQQQQQQQQQQPDPFSEAAGGPAGGLGGGAMGGLFQGLFQNLSAATPLMAAAMQRAQQAAQHQPAAAAAEELPRSANRSPAPEAGGAAPAHPGATPAAAGAGPQHHVFVNTMSAAQPPPPPSNVFHVHVHVTMDELRDLPERLTAFNTRMARAAPNAQVHVQTAQGVPNARAAAAHAAANPNPGQSRPPGTAAPAAAAPVEPTLAEVQAATGVPAAECKTITKVLQESVIKDAGMGEVMGLVSGDWSCVEKTRAPLRALAMRRCNGNPTPALRAELVEEAVADAVEKLEANADAQQQIRSRVRTGANVSAFVRAAARGALRALLDLAIDGHRAPHTSFPQAFRAATVRNVGHSLHFAERNIARNGSADVDAIVQVAVQMAVKEATTARPDLAGVAGMAPMMVLPTLRAWQEEYARSMRRPGDDGNLEMEIRRSVACSTRGGPTAAAAVAAPAAAADDDDGDAVLDAALNEAGTGGGGGAGSSTEGAGGSLSAALRALPAAARERVVRDAAVDAQAAVAPPPKHYFAGERHDALE